MLENNLQLVSYELCPYVQRSIITLDEKSIKHTRKYIDLNNPPKWFIKKSPLGKVPLLLVGDNYVLFESAVICEYLDEITPGSLHSSNPLIKALHRAWIEFGSQMLNDIGNLYCSNSEIDFNKKLEILFSKISQLENIISLPYFSGSDFRMIDAVFATIFRYFDVIDIFLPYDIFGSSPNVKQWRITLSKRESVKNAVKADYPSKLHSFLCERNSYISTLLQRPSEVAE